MKINLPNKLTIARIILCPFFMIFIVYPIPSEVWSRIIAAADAFSAMTSDRPYRKAMSVEQAVEILMAESKWAPVVVEAIAKVTKA